MDAYFGDDHEGTPCERESRAAHAAALDGVFDRRRRGRPRRGAQPQATAGRLSSAGGRHRRARPGGLGLFGKSTEGSEERDAELVTEGRKPGMFVVIGQRIDTRLEVSASVPQLRGALWPTLVA